MIKQLNICMLSRTVPSHNKGGMEDHVLTLSKGLVKRGHRVSILTTLCLSKNEFGYTKSHENIDGVDIFYIQNSKPKSYFGGYWDETVRILEQRPNTFDIIHSQSAAGYGLIKSGFTTKHNIPMVTSLHGTNVDEIKTQFNVISWDNLITPVLAVLQQCYHYFKYTLPLVQLSDGVIVTSNEQESLVNKYYRPNNDKLFKVFNGIDTEIYKHVDILPTTDILCIARLEKEKGIQYMIKAMPIIHKSIPTAKLTIIGDGSYKSKLMSMSNRIENIEFIGSIEPEEIPKYLNSCKIFINPTIRQNGYDLTILEAMSCGKPTIVTDIGSIPTVVLKGENGWTVPKKDVGELSDIVIRLLKSDDTQKYYSEHAMRTIKDRFTVDRMVDDTIKVYEKVIDETRI